MQSHSTLDIVLTNHYFSATTSIIDVHAILHHSATSAMITCGIVASIPIVVFPSATDNNNYYAMQLPFLILMLMQLPDYKARLGVTHPII